MTELSAVTIDFARKLHGHIGPYLIIGLKMGEAAKKAFGIKDEDLPYLRAEVVVLLHPPFSCLLDGIQVSTTCTIGNQRLQFNNGTIIRVTFTCEDSSKIVKIKLAKQFYEQLELRHIQDKLDEEYAWELVELSENQMFFIDVE